jgi:tetratricopeptide (TPR) repeat protein
MCSAPQAVLAVTAQDLHLKLENGGRVSAEEAESLNSQLSSGGQNPFNHAVAAEVLISLGLYDQAEEEYDKAERLEKNYVKTMFRKELSSHHHTLRLLAPYVQKKYPDDSALLFYIANRDLAGAMLKQNMSTLWLQPLIDEFQAAANAKDPWDGALAILSMLEYNEASRIGKAGAETYTKNNPQTLYAQSVKHAREELQKDPKNVLALKYYVLGMIRAGKVAEARAEIAQLLAIAPLDAEANLLLAKFYIANGDRHSALIPALVTVLAEQKKPVQASGSFKEVSALIRNCDEKQILDAAAILLNLTGWNTMQGNLLCLRISDLLAASGKKQLAIMMLEAGINRCGEGAFQVIMFKLGRLFMATEQYDKALSALDTAYKASSDEVFAKLILSLKNRAEGQAKNAHRNLALQLKRRYSNR